MHKIITLISVIAICAIIPCGCCLRPPAQINPTQPSPLPENNTISTPWIYPKSDAANPVWGIKNGIAIGVQKNGRPPEMDNAPGGAWAPGLFYIMWTDSNRKTYFFNYIGLSLISIRGIDQSEPSKTVYYAESKSYLDKLETLRQQKGENSQEYRDYVDLERTTPGGLSRSTTIDGDVMTVVFRLSKFEKNDTFIYVIITIDSKNPREIGISAQNMFPETKPLKVLHVSATAGSYARLRDLYLKDEVINAKKLWADSKPNIMCFYPLKTFALEKLPIDQQGQITVRAGNDEMGPWTGEFGSKTAPYYGGQKYYQYWRKYSDTYHNDLKITVNGRERYFAGYANPCGTEITDGIVYENFDMLEEYFSGQSFWFGYTYD